jgi:hydroxymethylpyrimidine pyrophosphatase-like HAD family hydrolase
MKHLRILACDLDGTLTSGDTIAPETWEALRRAKRAGMAILLATGRRLETFDAKGLFAELCEAIVAEDGAVVYFPRLDRTVLPFGRLHPALLQRLAALSIPMAYGQALVATYVPHDGPILEVLRQIGGGAVVEYNRGAVMVLPPGATKGTGVQFALQELGYSSHNLVTCGDAENDRSLFEIAEVGVAVANAAPAIQALADLVAPYPNAAGVRWLIDCLLTDQLPALRERSERRIFLGMDANEQPLYLDPSILLGGNLGVFGGSATGKSWIAGLLVEELLKHGYRVCVIDPEGDYRSLHAFPHTLLLSGPDAQLPPVADVISLAEYGNTSFVLDMSMCEANGRACYVTDLIHAFKEVRERRGIPHWLLLDEAHSLCPSGGSELNALCQGLMQTGGVAMVSYRPSQVQPELLALLDQWILTCTRAPEEMKVLERYLPGLHDKITQLHGLSTLPQGQGCLVRVDNTRDPPTTELTLFRTGLRTAPHIRHLNKYLQAPLPATKRFYYCDTGGRFTGRVAASLAEFRQTLNDAPASSIDYHLYRGDFERWLREVLHDEDLARQLRRLAHRELHGEELRDELSAVVDDRYEMLASLT